MVFNAHETSPATYVIQPVRQDGSNDCACASASDGELRTDAVALVDLEEAVFTDILTNALLSAE